MALGSISKDLIEKAIKGDSAETRALATQAIGRVVRDAPLTDVEQRLAAQIFTILSRDVAEEVRRALAVTLRLSKNLPREVANRLIRDVDSIAVPVLQSSPVVTDDDLLSILDSAASAKLQAIASRMKLSGNVSHKLLKSNDIEAVRILVANDTALISEADAAQLVSLSKQDDLIREAALRRRDMPQDLAVKLIDAQVVDVDTKLSHHTEHHTDIAADTRSRAVSRWSAQDWSSSALQAYVASLYQRSQLTDEVVARAAGQGDWRFLQIALSLLAGLSLGKTSMMMLDRRALGITTLLDRTNLGDAARTMVFVSADAFRDLDKSGMSLSRDRFQRLMEERIATHPFVEIFGEEWENWLDSGLGPKNLS